MIISLNGIMISFLEHGLGLFIHPVNIMEHSLCVRSGACHWEHHSGIREIDGQK